MSVFVFLFGVTASAGLTWALSRATGRLQILDVPNLRSMHSSPVPRSGGVAIMLVLFCNAAYAHTYYMGPSILYWLFGPLLLLVCVAWMDDIGHVSAWWRLGVQAGAALLLVTGADLAPEFAAAGAVQPGMMIIAVFFVVWMVNLYNFMDGMDGLAAGMAVIGFSSFAWLGWVAEMPLFTYISLSAVSAVLGFWLFNFPPARIFMGDTGSYGLGFLAAAMSLWGLKLGIFPVWCPLLIFSPFIVDASITLLVRISGRERVFDAHKRHYYQRLEALGWSHRDLVRRAYGLMLICALGAIMGVALSGLGLAVFLAAWCVSYAVLLRAIKRLEVAR